MKLERAKRAGRRFLNPVPTELFGPAMIVEATRRRLASRTQKVPEVRPGPFRTEVSAYSAPSKSGLRVTWFGHSSMLLEIDALRVLIDPVWDERAGPVTFAGPQRFFAPTIGLSDLPPLDAVLISHDHFDHIGRRTVETLAKLQPELSWICPLAVGAVLVGFGVGRERVTELDWTDSTVLRGRDAAALTLTAIPARHFSGRSLFGRNKTLWASYCLRGAVHSIYYGADSGPWDGFEAIWLEFGPFDLTMLEIGAYDQLWGNIHLGPDGAADALAALGGGLMMPIHWGLFNLALHDWRQPIERMIQLADERGIALFSPTPGVPSEVERGIASTWWRG